jgi:uncharacterized delta-60 repeat protein
MKTQLNTIQKSIAVLAIALGLNTVVGHATLPGRVDISFQSKLDTLGIRALPDHYITTVRRQRDGKVIVAGEISHDRPYHLYRLTTTGAVDTTFNPGGAGPDGYIGDIQVLSDGKLLIAGKFTQYNGTPVRGIARLNANGTLDRTFRGGSGLNGSVNVIVPLPTGQFLLGGSFSSYNGTPCSNPARINGDGTLDAAFNHGQTGVVGMVWTAALLRDGSILLGGDFTAYNGLTRTRVAKINRDGSAVSTSFLTVTGPNAPVRALLELPDGKVLIGGQFTRYMTVACGYLICVEPNGLPSSGFATPAFNNRVDALTLLRGGQILAGGYFTAAGSLRCNGLALMLSSGHVRVSFDSPCLPDTVVTEITEQPDGRVLLGGLFDGLRGISSPLVARMEMVQTGNVVYCGTATPFAVNLNVGSFVKITIRPDQSFSASVTRERETLRFSGRFSGTYWSGLLTMRDGGSLIVDMHKDREENGTEIVYGYLIAEGGNSEFLATAAYYHSRHRPALQNEGLHTAYMVSDETLYSSHLPNGHGIVSLTVSRSGEVRMVGVSGDGHSFTFSSHLDAANNAYVHIPIHSSRGSFHGAVQFSDREIAHNVLGHLDWIRPEMTGSTATDPSTPFSIPCVIRGSDYQAEFGFGMTPVSASTPASLTVDGGYHGRTSQTQDIAIENNVRISFRPGTFDNLSLSANPRTGLISGSYGVPYYNSTGRLLSQRTATLRGLMVQSYGMGFGTSIMPSSTTSTVKRSAMMTIETF